MHQSVPVQMRQRAREREGDGEALVRRQRAAVVQEALEGVGRVGSSE